MNTQNPFMQIYYQVSNGSRFYFYVGKDRAAQGWQNLAMPSVSFIEDRGPNQHGTTVRDYRLQTRDITIEWFGRDCFGRQCEYAQVVEAIRPTHDSVGYIRVINQDTSLLEIPARIQNGPSGSWNINDGLTPKQVKDVLQFYCPDPIWREVKLNTASAEISVEDSCLPMCLPACIGSGILSASIDICYNGSWPGDQITFTLVGPLDTPLITNETTGKIIELNYNIPSNDIVTITILPEQVTVVSLINGNIIGTVTNISDLVFFTLAPRQVNTITFGGANGVEGSSGISMTYYNRYLSVYDPCSDVCESTEPDTFITVWETSNEGESDNNQIQLPLESSGSYNFVVDWGDGTEDVITAWDQAETLHTFPIGGTYTVKMTGLVNGWSFNYSGDPEKLLEVRQWGTGFRLGNSGWYFGGCINMNVTATDAINLTGTTTLEGMFSDCFALEGNSSFNLWNISNIVNTAQMFWATSFNNSLSSWNTSNVTNMSRMFAFTSNFNQNISNWDVGNVVDMSEMFWGSVQFNQSLNSWNVSNVVNMNAMFSNANQFNQDLNSWDVSNVTNMATLFDAASSFNGNITAWNVGNVTTTHNMFGATSAFNQDISGWDVSNVTNMSAMFGEAIVFNQNIGGWDVSNVTNMASMFGFAVSFDQDLGSWDVGSVTNMSNMFDNVMLSSTNYDNLLIGWESLSPSLQNGVTFDGGNSQYTAAAASARAALISNHSWSISDGGMV